MLLRTQDFIERILPFITRLDIEGVIISLTIDRITTHGRFKEETISTARLVFPETELPAMPIMLVSAHGGE